jgi:hypothetical protein
LFETGSGRVAYVYDVLVQADAAARAFAIGVWIGRPDVQVARFGRFIDVMKRVFSEWDVNVAPFARPAYDLTTVLARVRAAPDGTPAGIASPAFWERAFEGSPAVEPRRQDDTRFDAAWLVDAVLTHTARERERRLDQLGFAGRVFADLLSSSLDPADYDDVLAAIREFPRVPALMLTLERMGIRTPSLYAAAARRAERLNALDTARAHGALAQFQGGLVLVERLEAVRTIDRVNAESLVLQLVSVELNDEGRYGGAIASWIEERLRPQLPEASGIEAAVLAAAAGAATPREQMARISWEGQRYRVDSAGAELRRLERARARQGGITLDSALRLARVSHTLAEAGAADGPEQGLEVLTEVLGQLRTEAEYDEDEAMRSGDDPLWLRRTLEEAAKDLSAPSKRKEGSDSAHLGRNLAAAADVALGKVLLSLAYAFSLGDPEGTILIAGDVSRRHDFGSNLSAEERARTAWSISIPETRGQPWHLVGSALALDVAMAPLALKRVHIDRVPDPPTLNVLERDGFAATVALMRAPTLGDEQRDLLDDAMARGRQRLARAVAGAISLDEAIRDIALDGWRSRALRWTLRHDPDVAPALLSLTELAVLGGATPPAFDAWGSFAFRTHGCYCLRMFPAGEWRRWSGLSQFGLPAVTVSDHALRVATLLRQLALPATLAKPILAAAMQDFIDNAKRTDGNDWLTLVRTAQAMTLDQISDYIAAAAADGPLLPDTP